MVGYVPRADDEEHLQTIPYIDPALRMKENSAWQSCVGSVKQCYVDNKFVLMSLNLNCMRHSSHFAHFNPGPFMFHLRSEISGISGIASWVARVFGATSGRLSSWNARYLKISLFF